ncbi:MAG: SDR family NAD(P)-dependent oxidoreductase [Planctomycetota bacterium]|jgi:NAD(P)-dependent dehydrogenase (short-subunit alcohol dehydrogenase family)
MKIESITAVITGSSGRLGFAIAQALAEAGCNCICHYNHNEQKALELVGEIQKAGSKALAIQADLTKPDQIGKLFTLPEEFDTPRILINSAAVFSRKPLADITFDEAQQILNLNLTAAILTSQAFAKAIKSKDPDADLPVGKIINISDIGGIRPWAGYVLYCSSKAGLIGATKALAKELAPAICVNSVAPGVIIMPENYDELQHKRQLSFIPMARFGRLEELTASVLFLLQNDYITGQVLNVDGGRCI